jgi:hypothetical protein
LMAGSNPVISSVLLATKVPIAVLWLGGVIGFH